MIGGHDGEAGGEGFEDGNPLRLGVRRRHREQVDVGQQTDLAGVVDLPTPLKAVGQSKIVGESLAALEVGALRLDLGSGRDEAHVVRRGE